MVAVSKLSFERWDAAERFNCGCAEVLIQSIGCPRLAGLIYSMDLICGTFAGRKRGCDLDIAGRDRGPRQGTRLHRFVNVSDGSFHQMEGAISARSQRAARAKKNHECGCFCAHEF